MAFGHDPNPESFPCDPAGQRYSGTITSRYDGRIFMLDAGMSSPKYSDGFVLRVLTAKGQVKASSIYPNGTVVDMWSGGPASCSTSKLECDAPASSSTASQDVVANTATTNLNQKSHGAPQAVCALALLFFLAAAAAAQLMA